MDSSSLRLATISSQSISKIYSRNPIAHFVAGGCVHFTSVSGWQVLNGEGRRKYLSAAERQQFLRVMDSYPPNLKALGYVLLYSGCRISEALALTQHQIDTEQCRLIFRTLKRRRLIFRAVPVPELIVAMLRSLPVGPDGRIWTMHRATAYRHIKRVMIAARIEGPMACCRGLRHGYGIMAATSKVPPALITKWMGHSNGSTTAIYVDAVGSEERDFASRMWRGE